MTGCFVRIHEKEELLFIHVSDRNGKYEITEEYEI